MSYGRPCAGGCISAYSTAVSVVRPAQSLRFRTCFPRHPGHQTTNPAVLQVPVYEETLEDNGRFNEQPVLPFNAYGTIALARSEFEANDGSSQFFFLLKVPRAGRIFCMHNCAQGSQVVPGRVVSISVQHAEHMLSLRVSAVIPPTAQLQHMATQTCTADLQESELTPTGSNLLDGRFAVFAYVVDNADLLGELQASRSAFAQPVVGVPARAAQHPVLWTAAVCWQLTSQKSGRL
jgi:cyclophilin family peptidyl-prolyl cis-trans isomerase